MRSGRSGVDPRLTTKEYLYRHVLECHKGPPLECRFPHHSVLPCSPAAYW